MAKIEENTKRRPNEMDEQNVTPRPPPKKRFLSSRASSPNEDPEDNDDSTDTFKEPLEAFRKDAIARQWKEYIRSVQRWKKHVEQAEFNKQESEDHLRLWEESFKKLQTFLSNVIQEGLNSFGDIKINTETNEFGSLLKEEWAAELAPEIFAAFQSKDYTDLTLSQLNQLSESWIAKRVKIITGFESVFENDSLKEIQKDHDRILSSWVDGQRSLQDLRHRYRLTNFKHLFFLEELRLLNGRLELADVNIRQAQFDLEKVERMNDAKNEDVKMTDVVTNSTLKPISPSLPTTPGKEPSTLIYNNQGSSRTPTTATDLDPLIYAQQLLEQRLQEIEHLKEDRIGLKQQIARLEIDLINIPESRIYKTPLCRHLIQLRSHQRDKCNRQFDICHDLQNRMDDPSSSRRKLIKELNVEQISYFKMVEEQLSKLDLDLTRIRGQRDALQMSYEERKASTEAGKASIAELKIIGDTRKERVSYLETEILRLQKKMAARTGVKEYYDLLQQSDGREPLLLPLQNELKQLEEQVAHTKVRYYANDAPKETLDRELALISDMKKIELQIAKFEHKYGFHPSSATDDTEVINILQDRIKHENKVVQESNGKIQALEATEKQLLSEIESVAKAYGDLEEENISKVRELAALEDDITRLQIERVKYSQTFTALNKSKDAHSMVASALSKQIEKQLAHIKQLNEREKNLMNQMTSLEREYTTCNSVYDIYKQKAEEIKLTSDELNEKLIFSKDNISELQKSILEKIRSIEEGAHSRLRLEESSELLKRKIDSTNKVDRPAEAKLRKEREEYKSLLNCSSCRTRLKSHIILKCMHTFCKECLESKRRCPSCDEPFNPQDVKQFYF